jgi:hypothetical protein
MQAATLPGACYGKEYTHVPFLLHLSPDRQPKAVREVLICQGATKRAHNGWARRGKTVQPVTPHLVVLITTGNKSVFRRMYNTKSSRRYHKRKLSSHTSVTSSYCLKTHVRERRSAQKGKVAGFRSVSLPRGANQAGFLLEREDREKRLTSYPPSFAPHWLNSPFLFFSSPSQRESACALVSGTQAS